MSDHASGLNKTNQLLENKDDLAKSNHGTNS